MNAKLLFRNYFNWRMLLIRILVNMLALLFTVAITPNIEFLSPSLLNWFLMALILGLITAFVKPIIQFLTLRFIFATAGLVLVIINTVILYLLQWLAPQHFAISGLLWAAVGGLVLGISSTFLEDFLGVTPPIVSEKYPEIRQQVNDRQFYRMQNELTRIEAVKKGRAQQVAAAKTMVVESNPAMAQLFSKDQEQLSDEAFEEASDRDAFYEQVQALTESAIPAQTEPLLAANAPQDDPENTAPKPVALEAESNSEHDQAPSASEQNTQTGEEA